MQSEFATRRQRTVSPTGIGVILIALVAAMLVPAGFSFGQGMSATPKAKTLYERIGGYDVIAGLVDDFIHQLGEDPAFKRFGGGRLLHGPASGPRKFPGDLHA